MGVEAAIGWASNTGYNWLDRTFQVLGGVGTAVIAWFLFPSIVVGVSGVFLDRVVDATETAPSPAAARAPAGAAGAERCRLR